MIKTLSLRIASHLGYHLQTSEAEVEVYAYGLESFINNVMELALLLLLAWRFNLLLPTLIVLASFALIRVPGGGAHFRTFPRCLIASLLAMLGLAKLGLLITWDTSAALGAVVILAAVGMGIIQAWVPAGTEKKRVTDGAEIKQQKRVTTIGLLLNSLAALGCFYGGYAEQGTIVFLGSLWGLFVITPWGYHFFHTLDHGMDVVERRCAM